MKNYGLDLHAEMLLDDYREQLPLFQLLQQVVEAKLRDAIGQMGIEVNTVETRIKEEASLAGKLARKGDKYGSLDDITDIFGARIIAFYNEDVDRIASMAESLFDIDWPTRPTAARCTSSTASATTRSITSAACRPPSITTPNIPS